MTTQREIHEITLTCDHPGCGHFYTERTNFCGFDTSRMREDLARRGWQYLDHSPEKSNAYNRFSRTWIDLCPSCTHHYQPKPFKKKPAKGTPDVQDKNR